MEDSDVDELSSGEFSLMVEDEPIDNVNDSISAFSFDDLPKAALLNSNLNKDKAVIMRRNAGGRKKPTKQGLRDSLFKSLDEADFLALQAGIPLSRNSENTTDATPLPPKKGIFLPPVKPSESFPKSSLQNSLTKTFTNLHNSSDPLESSLPEIAPQFKKGVPTAETKPKPAVKHMVLPTPNITKQQQIAKTEQWTGKSHQTDNSYNDLLDGYVTRAADPGTKTKENTEESFKPACPVSQKTSSHGNQPDLPLKMTDQPATEHIVSPRNIPKPLQKTARNAARDSSEPDSLAKVKVKPFVCPKPVTIPSNPPFKPATFTSNKNQLIPQTASSDEHIYPSVQLKKTQPVNKEKPEVEDEGQQNLWKPPKLRKVDISNKEVVLPIRTAAKQPSILSESGNIAMPHASSSLEDTHKNDNFTIHDNSLSASSLPQKTIQVPTFNIGSPKSKTIYDSSAKNKGMTTRQESTTPLSELIGRQVSKDNQPRQSAEKPEWIKQAEAKTKRASMLIENGTDFTKQPEKTEEVLKSSPGKPKQSVSFDLNGEHLFRRRDSKTGNSKALHNRHSMIDPVRIIDGKENDEAGNMAPWKTELKKMNRVSVYDDRLGSAGGDEPEFIKVFKMREQRLKRSESEVKDSDC